MEESSLTYYAWLKKRIDEFVAQQQNPELEECMKSAPDMFVLLLMLLRDTGLSPHVHHGAASILSYFLLPTDLVPEAYLGVHGIKEDLFFVALFLEKLREQGNPEIVEKNWIGDLPVFTVVDRVLSLETQLVKPEIASALRRALESYR